MSEHEKTAPTTLHEVQALRELLQSIAETDLHRPLLEDEQRLLAELLEHRVSSVAEALGRLQPEIPSFLLENGEPL